MNTTKQLLTGSLLTVLALTATAQDARFAQSYANPLRINPAIMGSNRDIKFGMNYRTQWGTIDKGFKTSSFTAMYPIILKDQNGKVDIGVNFLSDKAGAFKTTDVALALDYSKEISPNNNLCLSLMAGYLSKSFSLADQTFDYQYMNGAYTASNPTGEANMNEKVSTPDVGFGFMWFYNPNKKESRISAFAGLSGYHLNQPNMSFMQDGDAKLAMRFSYQAGLKIYGNNKVDLSPQIRVNNQNGNVEPAGGLYMNYHFNPNFDFVLGGWYRAHDANCVVVGFEHANFTLGYSYDMISGGLNDAKNNVKAHEITLSIRFNRGMKAKDEMDEVEKEIMKGMKSYSSPIPAF